MLDIALACDRRFRPGRVIERAADNAVINFEHGHPRCGRPPQIGQREVFDFSAPINLRLFQTSGCGGRSWFDLSLSLVGVLHAGVDHKRGAPEA